MGNVPTSNLTALYTNTTPGTTADPAAIDAAIIDIVATVNGNSDFVNGLISSDVLSELGVINVKDYNASGLATTATGSITSGTKLLTLTTTPDFVAGQGINLQGAFEVASLQITAPASASANCTVTLNGVAFTVALASGDTAVQAATKIRAATFSGWTAGGTALSDTVTFTSLTTGTKTDASYSAGTTGATGTMTTTTQGTADQVSTVSSVSGLVVTIADNSTRTITAGTFLHDDEASFTAAYNAVKTSGGKIIIPPGIYNGVHLLIVEQNIIIEGSSRSAAVTQGGIGGTVLKPRDLTRPVIQIGDGVADVSVVSLRSFTALGESITNTSDGIVIKGAYYVNIDDIGINGFGRDNLRIESTAAQSSFFINISNFTSRWARGSSFKAVYGAGYVTSVQLVNFSISGYSTAGCRAVYLDAVKLNAVNGWIESGNDLGNVYLTGSNVEFHGHNVAVDSSSSNDVLWEINRASTTSNGGIACFGSTSIDGKVRFSDGVFLTSDSLKGTVDYHKRLSYPIIRDALVFGDNSGTATPDQREQDETVAPLLYRKLKSAGVSVQLDRASFCPQMTYIFPLQTGSNGSLWRNATTGRLRYKFDTWQPASDAVGRQLKECQSGTTAQRPTDVDIGYDYFDTTLGKPVWLKTGTTWVDATGTTV